MSTMFLVLGYPNSRMEAGVLDLELIRLGLSEEPVEVCLLDLGRLHDLESIAARFLTAREQAEYAELRHPLRRREWLGAGVCLKLMEMIQGRADDLVGLERSRLQGRRPRHGDGAP